MDWKHSRRLEHDVDGKAIMYHGTTMSNAFRIQQDGFKPSVDGMLGPGVYVTPDIRKAAQHPTHTLERKCILECAVDPGRVKKITKRGGLQKNWQRSYDTAWVPPNCGMTSRGFEENCVKDPERIRVNRVIENPGMSTISN